MNYELIFCHKTKDSCSKIYAMRIKSWCTNSCEPSVLVTNYTNFHKFCRTNSCNSWLKLQLLTRKCICDQWPFNRI